MNFLSKIFIKDFKNVSDPKVRAKHGLLASIVGILTNLLLFTFKLVIGILSLSISIISDAINNLTDLFSSVVNLIGFKISTLPPDKKHPFGHERVEYISGMIVSFIIVSLSIVLGYTSINSLISQTSNTNYSLFTFIILGVSLVVKLLLGLFYYQTGKAINSLSLKAAMRDSLNDFLITSFLLISVLVQHYYPNLWYIDSAMSLILSLIILIGGIKSIMETSAPLIGERPDPELIENIKKDVLSYHGVLGVHDIIMHSYGPSKIFITLHVEIDGYLELLKAHDVIDKIEHDITHKYNCNITIHMDPVDTKDKELKVIKQSLTRMLHNIDKRLTYHDLRTHKTEDDETMVMFEIALPYDLKISELDILNKIKDGFREIDENYLIAIKFETDLS